MKHYTKTGLAGLLAVVALTVASCGGASGGSDGGMDGMDKDKMKKDSGSNEKMSGMDRDSGEMKGMKEGSGGMASEMVMKDGKYSDERFIDAMIPHHEGAVEMAEVGLKNAEHEEIKQLSEEIISAQQAEIEELKSIKQEEFGSSEAPMKMGMEEMEGMGMMMDPQSLADQNPFDKAFIDNMTPHHQSAIEMAEVAAKNTGNERVKSLATDIIEGQERELSQMKQWREEWYPES